MEPSNVVAAGGCQIYTETNATDIAKVNAKQLNFKMTTMCLLTTLLGDFYSYF